MYLGWCSSLRMEWAKTERKNGSKIRLINGGESKTDQLRAPGVVAAVARPLSVF